MRSAPPGDSNHALMFGITAPMSRIASGLSLEYGQISLLGSITGSYSRSMERAASLTSIKRNLASYPMATSKPESSSSTRGALISLEGPSTSPSSERAASMIASLAKYPSGTASKKTPSRGRTGMAMHEGSELGIRASAGGVKTSNKLSSPRPTCLIWFLSMSSLGAQCRMLPSKTRPPLPKNRKLRRPVLDQSKKPEPHIHGGRLLGKHQSIQWLFLNP